MKNTHTQKMLLKNNNFLC